MRPLSSFRRLLFRPLALNHPRFLRDEGGATALEYGLVTAFIAIATLAAMAIFGNSLGGLFAKLPDLFPS